MIKIKTISDLERIRADNQIPEAIVIEIERYFKELCYGLTGEEDAWMINNLESDGPILVLEPGVDNPSDLKAYGMTAECGGIFAVPVEFTEKVVLDNLELFKTLILLDNSFCLTIFSQAGNTARNLMTSWQSTSTVKGKSRWQSINTARHGPTTIVKGNWSTSLSIQRCPRWRAELRTNRTKEVTTGEPNDLDKDTYAHP